MKYLVVLVLAVLGLVEFALRVVSIPVSFFLVLAWLEEDLFADNFCFELATDLVMQK